MNKWSKLASKLNQLGFKKIAGDVLDLLEHKRNKTQRNNDNKKLSDRIKEDNRIQDIYRQHEQDKLALERPQLGSDLYPSVITSDPSRRYDVSVRYPNFNDDGSPYFDETCIEEQLSITADELKNFQWQEQQGYLQILDADPNFPQAD